MQGSGGQRLMKRGPGRREGVRVGSVAEAVEDGLGGAVPVLMLMLRGPWEAAKGGGFR